MTDYQFYMLLLSATNCCCNIYRTYKGHNDKK